MNSERPIIENVEIVDVHSSGNHFFINNEKKYFVPKVISGEIIHAKILNKRYGFRIASAVCITKKSEHRIKPPCTYYEMCEGCNFLHIEYSHQIEIKQKLIQKAFDKYNIPFQVPPVKAALKNLYYRNNATFKIHKTKSEYSTGFIYDKKSFIKIQNCLIIKNEINKLNEVISCWLNNENNKTSLFSSFTIRTNEDKKSILIFNIIENLNIEEINFELLKKYFIGIYVKFKDNNILTIYEKEQYYEKVNNRILKIHPLAFFQNNIEITEKIVKYISYYVSPEQKILYDLYCGNGSLSLSIVEDNSNYSIYGIDNNSYAISDANFNAISLKKGNEAIFICGDVLETFNTDFLNKYPKPDIIILDPPRSGTLIEILKNIVNSKAKQIIYVSCNPVSLAWNLSLILEHYKIIQVQAFDMFPQTHHVETVVILERIN